MSDVFTVSGTDITLSRGDTGAVVLTASGYDFGSSDRALFSVRNGAGTMVIQRIYEMEDNAFTVTFFNADTDTLMPGTYYWDVRYVINPTYDTSGNIIDGDQVLTPNTPMNLKLLAVAGDI